MRILLISLLLLSSASQAVIETYEFDNDSSRERYHRFIEELRCPKCQNQNLSGSNSPIAEDLRRELHRMLGEGRTDQQIVEYMVDRYGEFILYRPRLNRETALLWFAPLLFLMLGVVTVVMIVKKQKQAILDDEPKIALSEAEQQKLKRLLDDGSQTGSDND